MCENQRAVSRVIHALSDTDSTDSVISQLDTNILPSSAFLDTLSPHDASKAKQACLIAWALTRRIILKEWQLGGTLDILAGRDTILNAGTGSGKTMLIILPALLRPGSISITISPLKRLMASQAAELGRYGLRAAIVNEDTTHDPELFKAILDGYYDHVHVSPEQLQRHQGHFTRFYHLLDNPTFRRQIRVINVDEGHEAGRAALGLDDFRTSYARLSALRLKLPQGIPFVVLSATLPPHILSPLLKLLFLKNAKETRLCLNRPNIYYAVQPLITGTKEFRNLSLLVPASTNFLGSLRKTIIFFDDKRELDGACSFLRNKYTGLMNPTAAKHQILPAARALVKGYHSDMSSTYLQSTYEDFNAPDGSCKILCATACAATVSSISVSIFSHAINREF
jgi:superfamily II DNA helicase RecQ